MLYPITLYFLIRRGPERRASRAYLQRITGRKASLWQVARHIHCFAAVTLDRAFLLSERFKRFDVRTYGLDELRQAWAQQRGVLILGSHLGSFDALRVLARVPLGHQAARRDRRRAEPQAVAGAECAQPEAGAARSSTRGRKARRPRSTIKEALDEKSLVTLLADRARPGNQVMTVDFLGQPRAVPDWRRGSWPRR